MKLLLEKWKNLKLPVIMVIAMCIAIGCSDKDEPTTPSLIGHWYWTEPSGIMSTEIIFKNDGTYWIYLDTPFGFPVESTGTYTTNENRMTTIDDQYYIDGDEDLIGNGFFELGRDKNGDYLIMYEYEDEREEALHNMKLRRKK